MPRGRPTSLRTALVLALAACHGPGPTGEPPREPSALALRSRVILASSTAGTPHATRLLPLDDALIIANSFGFFVFGRRDELPLLARTDSLEAIGLGRCTTVAWHARSGRLF